MPGLDHWLPGHDALTVTFAFLVFAAGIVTALMFRDVGARGVLDIFMRGAGLLIFAVLAWLWLGDSDKREQAAERRALDVRTSELTAQAIAPGSALACLDGVGLEAVDAACVQAIFASPQTVSAAVAYTNARLSLLADGLGYAARDKSYADSLERLRRGLEADRFGIVAHVLAGRGCNVDECPAFKLFADAAQVKTNLKDRYFEAFVVRQAANWRSDGTASTAAATVPAAGTTPPAATAGLPQGPALPGTPLSSKYNFPSSASIPPVSIMSAEPPVGPEPSAGQRDTATGTATPQPKRQSANKPAPKPQQSSLPPPPQATMSNPTPPAR